MENDKYNEPYKSERKTLNDLWGEYEARYNGNPKYEYCHFITVMSNYEHHRQIVRPMIKHWQRIRKEMNITNPKYFK